MKNVNKTLYIPLYGKAFVSRKGLFLHDARAERIWAEEGFPLRRRARSKWLAYYLGIRAAVFDAWISEKMSEDGEAVVLHLGCGLDSRAGRVGECRAWYDVDLPEVIEERRKYFAESEGYHMVAGDLCDPAFLCDIPKARHAIVLMEGVSMYFAPTELARLFADICARFERVSVLADFYSLLAAKLSRHRNPVGEVGVTQVYGMDDPHMLSRCGLSLVKEHDMTPAFYVNELHGMEKRIFAGLYAGRFAKKLYRLFEFEKILDAPQ